MLHCNAFVFSVGSQDGDPSCDYRNESLYCSHCQQQGHHQSNFLSTRPPGDSLPLVQVSTVPDTGVTEDPYPYPFLSPNSSPVPVGAQLKTSNLDVLAVDYGRPPSVYSTGSEGNYDFDNDVFAKPGIFQPGTYANGLRPIPGNATRGGFDF